MRPPYRGDTRPSRPGPSDEFLAIDAASEERSFSVLYDRYADALYRFFLGASGDPDTADRLMDGFIADLPESLHRFGSGQRSFAGWLFGLASRRLEQNQYSPLRLVRRINRTLRPGRRGPQPDGGPVTDPDLYRVLEAMRGLPLIERQALVLHTVNGLEATQVSEAIGLPTLAISTRLGTGSATLNTHLKADSPEDARSLMASSLGAITLSDRQRERHRHVIRAAFGTVEETEAPPGSLARQLAVIVLVAVIGLAGLVGWDYVATRLTEEPAQEESAGDGGNGIGSAAAGDETPTPAGAAAEDSAEPCLADERIALVERFVQHLNDGEMDEVRAMLPESPDARPAATPTVVEDAADLETFIPFDSDEYDPDAVVERLQERYDAGDRWNVHDLVAGEDYPEWFGSSPIGPYQEWVDDELGLGLIMVNEMSLVPESEGHRHRGPVVVDCADEAIVAWGLEPSIPRDREPIDVLDFIFSTTSLNPGEERIWQVRALTDHRADGGGMRQWDLEWRQAVSLDGTLMQRGSVYTSGGEEIISYTHDGERWRLEQRGWTRFGTDPDIPFPEEIVQVVPWLNRSAGVIHLNSDEIAPRATQQLVSDPLDFSGSSAMHADAYSAPDAERTFALEIADGAVTGAHLQEVLPSGELHFRPTIHFINVNRVREFDEETYRFMFYPRYLDRDTSVPRFPMPDEEHDALSLEDASYAEDGSREEYLISWSEVQLRLVVTPSRGGIDWQRLSSEYDDHWRSDSEAYDHGVFQWSDNGVNGAPALARWDNGRFRFELHLEDMSPSGDDWSLRELVNLADVLSATGS